VVRGLLQRVPEPVADQSIDHPVPSSRAPPRWTEPFAPSTTIWCQSMDSSTTARFPPALRVVAANLDNSVRRRGGKSGRACGSGGAGLGQVHVDRLVELNLELRRPP